jgi:hypothetical protein
MSVIPPHTSPATATMLDQLKEASKLLIIPTAVLYLLGFVCITGYYGQFGIVTFDLANARFLIAGIYVAIALGAVLLVAWPLRTLLSPAIEFGVFKDVRMRLALYVLFLISTFVAAFLVHRILSFGRQSAFSTGPLFDFIPILGQADFVGNQLLGLSAKDNDLVWIALYTVDVAGLALFAWIVFELVRIVADAIWRPVSARPALDSKAGPLNFHASPMTVALTAPSVPSKALEPLAASWARALVGVEILVVVLLVVLFAHAFLKIRSDLFDLRALEKPQELSFALVYAWMYGTTIVVLFFLVAQKRLSKTEFSFLGLDINNFNGLVQFLVLPILSSIFLFGGAIFPRIAFSMGGGEPHEVTVTTKTGEWEKDAGRTYLLGESNQFIFVVAHKGQGIAAYEISKDQIAHFRTRILRSTKPTPLDHSERPSGK